MFFTITGVRRPKVGGGCGRGPTLAGVAVLATLLSGCVTTAPVPSALTAGVALSDSVSATSLPSATVRSAYNGRTRPKLPSMPLPDPFRRDSMARRHFEAGRRAAHAFSHQAVTVGRPVAPKLPASLMPPQPALRARAESAFAMGFERQVDQDSKHQKNQSSGPTATVVAVVMGVIVLIGLMCVAALALLNATVGNMSGAFSMHSP